MNSVEWFVLSFASLSILIAQFYSHLQKSSCALNTCGPMFVVNWQWANDRTCFELYLEHAVQPVEPSGHYMYRQVDIQKFYILPTHCIYVFCVDLRTNSHYFPIQLWLTGFYNWDVVFTARYGLGLYIISQINLLFKALIRQDSSYFIKVSEGWMNVICVRPLQYLFVLLVLKRWSSWEP